MNSMLHHGGVCLVAGAVFLLTVVDLAWGQPGVEPRTEDLRIASSMLELAADVRSLKNTFYATTEADVAQAHSNLRDNALQLSDYLNEGGGNGDAWKKYLRWSTLDEQIGPGAKVDLSALDQVYARFSDDHEGLELAVFRNTRGALEKYIQSRRDFSNPSLQTEFEDRLEAIAVILESTGDTPESSRLHEVAAHLGWLETRGQAAALVSRLRSRFSHPNLRIIVSDAFVSDATARSIDEWIPLSATVRDVPFSGSAHVRGIITAQLVPNDSQGHIAVHFDGDMTATMSGSRGPVSAQGAASASLAAEQYVTLDAAGAVAGSQQLDVRADARVTSITTSLARPLDRMVRRMACRAVHRQQGATQQSAHQQASAALSQRMDLEVQQVLNKFNEQYSRRLRSPLMRRDLFPDQVHLQTTSGGIEIGVVQASSSQFGAPTPPTVLGSAGDIAVQLHESAVNNFAAGYLAGRSYTQNELRAMFDGLSGSATRSGRTSNEDEVEMTMDAEHPLTLRIGQNTIAVTLRGQRFVVRNRVYPAMNVTVEYAIYENGPDFVARMVGEPLVVPPRFSQENGAKRFSARELAIRRILQNLLDRDLGKEVDVSKIDLAQPVGRIAGVSVTALAAEEGWLTISGSVNHGG